ncbi:hypothetical protein MNBD_PLANCTO03-1551 [hydrothermal vent metagenome]|uniref:Lipoprotein n=1 Tax=hydrothermal vent metagenome TaxID=652676 RepID=A0A3B1DBU4_9ZZZZ
MKPGLIAVVGLILLGCEDRPPLPPVVFEGEHIRYRTFEPEDEVCAGSFFMQDAKAGYLKDVFGTETNVDFSWVPDDRYFDYCPAPSGCAIESEVFALRPFNEHELAHGVRESAFPPLEEGLAVYFGGGSARDVAPMGTLEALLQPDVDVDDYGRLGRFVSYLVAEFGVFEVVALADDVPRGARPEEFEAAVDSRFGAPLAALVADFEDGYPECQPISYRHDQPFCDLTPILTLPVPGVDAPTVEQEFSLRCDDEGTLGTRSADRSRYETFAVQDRGLYNLTIMATPASSGSLVVLEQCGTSCFDEVFSSVQEFYDHESVCLDEGTYLMRIKRDDGSAGGFNFSATPVGLC